VILEVAILNIVPGEEVRFQDDFGRAQSIIASMKGYASHQLQRCIETPSRYILLVQWQALADHTGFRESPRYQEWKNLLHHHYHPFPAVEHYELIFSSDGLLHTGGTQ